MLYQVQIPIGGMPINLVLISDGTLVFIKVRPFGVLFDHPESGLKAIFHEDCFTIEGEEFHYDTIYQYKEIPNMLGWLKQQNLQEPVVQFM